MAIELEVANRDGIAEGDLVEVLGNLKPGDMVVRRATDEIRDGTAIQGPTTSK